MSTGKATPMPLPPTPRRGMLRAAGLVVAAGLLAACGNTVAAAQSPRSHATDMGMAGPPMPGMDMAGMDMAGTTPGNGLLATASSLTLRSLTSSVPAGRPSAYRFAIVRADGGPLTSYRAEQTKLLHLYVVRDDLTGFEHLHPALNPGGTWTVTINPAKAGSYRVFTQFTSLRSGRAAARPGGRAVSVVLSRPLLVTGPVTPPVPLLAAAATTRVDGYTVHIAGRIEAGRAGALTMIVTRAGRPATGLQPYLGAYAHLTAFHEGDLGFAHLHPSDAAGPMTRDSAGPALHFDAVLPETGDYRLFLQFRADGRLHTAQLTLPVS